MIYIWRSLVEGHDEPAAICLALLVSFHLRQGDGRDVNSVVNVVPARLLLPGQGGHGRDVNVAVSREALRPTAWYQPCCIQQEPTRVEGAVAQAATAADHTHVVLEFPDLSLPSCSTVYLLNQGCGMQRCDAPGGDPSHKVGRPLALCELVSVWPIGAPLVSLLSLTAAASRRRAQESAGSTSHGRDSFRVADCIGGTLGDHSVERCRAPSISPPSPRSPTISSSGGRRRAGASRLPLCCDAGARRALPFGRSSPHLVALAICITRRRGRGRHHRCRHDRHRLHRCEAREVLAHRGAPTNLTASRGTSPIASPHG